MDEKMWSLFETEILKDETIILGRKGWKNRVREILKKYPDIEEMVELDEIQRKFDRMFFNYYLSFMINDVDEDGEWEVYELRIDVF